MECSFKFRNINGVTGNVLFTLTGVFSFLLRLSATILFDIESRSNQSCVSLIASSCINACLTFPRLARLPIIILPLYNKSSSSSTKRGGHQTNFGLTTNSWRSTCFQIAPTNILIKTTKLETNLENEPTWLGAKQSSEKGGNKQTNELTVLRFCCRNHQQKTADKKIAKVKRRKRRRINKNKARKESS